MELELVVAALSAIVSVVASVTALAYWLGRKFALMDSGIKRVEGEIKGLRQWAEGEFGGVDAELKGLRQWAEAKFGGVDAELKGLREWAEAKFGGVDAELKGLRQWAEAKFGGVDAELKGLRQWAEGEFKGLRQWAEGRFEGVNNELKGLRAWAEDRFDSIERMIEGLGSASAEAHRAVVDFLALKGLTERAESEYLARRVEGVIRVHLQRPRSANPLTEEELRFLLEFFSRAAKNADDVTMDEAERAYELSKRFFLKERFDDAGFLAVMAATYIRGYLVSREVRKRKAEG